MVPSVVAIVKKALLAQLNSLAQEEQELAELEELRASVLQKEAALTQKRELFSARTVPMTTASSPQQQQPQPGQTGLFTLRELRKQPQQIAGQPSQSPLAAPLDNLLGLPPTAEVLQPLGFTWQEQLKEQQTNSTLPTSHSLQVQFRANESCHADMFLAPTAVPQGSVPALLSRELAEEAEILKRIHDTDTILISVNPTASGKHLSLKVQSTSGLARKYVGDRKSLTTMGELIALSFVKFESLK
eukprot:Seg3879.6 transcript_id=Seg3879.6/GoldUCD/mRNA.D3Y31 product="hypothetical protein" protein_id=Seg3879.6/GoldUCD/D3Y31